MVVKALLIDDDRDLARLLDEYLTPHDVRLVHVENGQAGLDALARGGEPFDVVLLDVMLPGMDGFEVCRRIRAAHDTMPIVMLTARGDDADRIVGLEIGADDYVPKPFNPRELLARVRAVLRRAKPAAQSASVLQAGATPAAKIVIGPIEIDVGGRTVHRSGAEVPLTSYEFRILVELAKRAGDTIAREELAAAVRADQHQPKGKDAPAYDPSVDRSLDVHVSRLRQKLEEDPKEPRFIKTVRGVGYVLARPA